MNFSPTRTSARWRGSCRSDHTSSPPTRCGSFANFGTIAIMIGGIGGLVPERRKDIARFGIRSMIGGALAANMTATVAGLLM